MDVFLLTLLCKFIPIFFDLLSFLWEVVFNCPFLLILAFTNTWPYVFLWTHCGPKYIWTESTLMVPPPLWWGVGVACMHHFASFWHEMLYSILLSFNIIKMPWSPSMQLLLVASLLLMWYDVTHVSREEVEIKVIYFALPLHFFLKCVRKPF